jgi:hypothetical protein
MAATITILERPIERIRETCDMMGRADGFNRAVPELETYLASLRPILKERLRAGKPARRGLRSRGLAFCGSDFCAFRGLADNP